MKSEENVFLGIDVGTSSVKAGYILESGGCALMETVEYPTYFGAGCTAEQDAWDWWKAATKAVQTLASKRPECAAEVKAISISCQAPALFGIGENGAPVGKSMIWMDRRAEEICREMEEDCGEYIRSYSMNRIDPYFMLPKMVWQKKHRPQQYRETVCYLQINGWLVYQLTGEKVIDQTNANLTQLMNVYTLGWEKGIFDRMGLDVRKMPEIVPCRRAVGTVRPEMAKLWRVPDTAVVAAGCVDGASSPFGLGLNEAGNIFEMSGTSSGIGVLLDHPTACDKLILMKHVRDGKWFMKGSTSCSGGSLKWIRDHIDIREAAFEDYSRMAQNAPAGANGILFLPYLNGERAPLWDSAARGVCFGFSADTRREDLIRAVMEGTAYALKSIQDEFPDSIHQDEVILGTGGGYNSRIWSQIKADVLGKPIRVKTIQVDAAVLGSAFLAMECLGFRIPEEKEDEASLVYNPNQENEAVYRKQYDRFRKLYAATKELF